MGRLNGLLIMLIGGVLAACATPSIKYNAKIAPGNPDAATYRAVAVDRFRGPLGEWYADEFEEMLQRAKFEGQPWFEVALFSRQSNVEGAYYGMVDISRPRVNEHYSTRSNCVERDKETKKCVKKKDIERVCVQYTVAVRTNTVLADANTDEIIHDRSYQASDSEQECFETGHVQYRVRRGPNDRGRGTFRFAYEKYDQPGYRLGSDHIIDRITASALRDTIWQARRDIAPYNRSARARILTKAERSEVADDPRFAQAVSQIRSGERRGGCSLFRELRRDFDADPAVLHNLGACAEANGNTARAQSLYAEALSSARGLGAEPERRMLRALDRISETRNDEVIINRILPDAS